MTSYITQTMARQHVSELIAQAERGRIRRDLRQARREARAAAREGASKSRFPKGSGRDPWLQYLIPAAR
jgi:hypothetical protein